MIMACKVHLYSKSWREMILGGKAFQIMQRMKFINFLKIQWERICMQLCLFTWLKLSFSTQNRHILHKNVIYWFIISCMSLVSSCKYCLLYFISNSFFELMAPLCFFVKKRYFPQWMHFTSFQSAFSTSKI